MMIPSNELACRTLFLQAADDGRGRTLFGDGQERACGETHDTDAVRVDPEFSCVPAEVGNGRAAVVIAKLESHGAVRFLLSSLRAVSEGYSAPEMISVIKSGYAPITEEDAWHLENYILSHGVRGKLWLSPFTRGCAQECA